MQRVSVFASLTFLPCANRPHSVSDFVCDMEKKFSVSRWKPVVCVQQFPFLGAQSVCLVVKSEKLPQRISKGGADPIERLKRRICFAFVKVLECIFGEIRFQSESAHGPSSLGS